VIRKQAQYAQVVQMRRRGFTYAEIAPVVGVSKAAVSNWLRNESWSREIHETHKRRAAKENGKRIRILNKTKQNQLAKQYAALERSAKTEYKHYSLSPSFVAGLTLYVALGNIEDMQYIRLSTQRIAVHRQFIAFAREYLGVPREKIRFWLLLYPTHDPETVSRHWAKEIRLPLHRFSRYQVSKTTTTKGVLHDGVGNTIIGDTVLKRKLLIWVKLATK
jgi:predicted transcriptional regulator